MPIFASLSILVAAVVGIIVGAWLGSRIGQARTQTAEAQAATAQQAAAAQIASLQTETGKNTAEIASLRSHLAAAQERAIRAEEKAERLTELTSALKVAEEGRQSLQNALAAKEADNARLSTELANERQNAGEKIKLLQESREELSNQFKTLAQEILEQKSKVFTEQNQANLSNLLHPIREKFTEFQQKVTELREQGIESSAALKTQIEGLSNLNAQLSKEASNLVSALKGSSKTQGDWGEFILEQILDSAGLRKGEQYKVQQTFAGEQDGEKRKFRPDVILCLPEGKNLVIDSKISLNAYSEYSSATDDAVREAALKQHLAAVHNHIRELSGRNYHKLYDLQSIDFVVMFVPIEPAYMLALAHDNNLWQKAWEQNVLLVGPSTLLFVVRTVAELWRQEQQSRNAQSIADRGAELYDKLAAFVKDLEDVGKNIDKAKTSFNEAYKKLYLGKGNAIRQAEMLRELGVKSTKQLPGQLIEMAHHETLELAAVSDERDEEE